MRLVNGASAAARTRSNWRLRVIGVAVEAPALGVEGHRAGGLLRSCGAAASDSVRPPGRARITLSADSSALRSSANGCTAMPWALASARRSTKSWLLIRPRVGPRPVMTRSLSPTVGVVQPMRLVRLVERNGDAGAAGADDVAGDDQRLGRARHRLADRDEPAGILRLDAGEARPFELEAHDLRIVLARHRGAADGLALIVAEHADVEHGLGVEHQPQRVGALEHRRGRRRRERKEQPQIVALTPKLGGHRAVGIALRQRGRARLPAPSPRLAAARPHRRRPWASRRQAALSSAQRLAAWLRRRPAPVRSPARRCPRADPLDGGDAATLASIGLTSTT